MLHRLFAVLLLAAAGSIVPLVASAAACSGTAGVTVVVDFDNGATRVGCAPGDPSSGYDALRKAGFTITNVQDGRNGAALCSIDNVPDHICTGMPPTSAYWAYFHVVEGEWKYSNTGGGSYNPKPGTVEGWHFRGSPSDPPGIAPPGAPSTSTPKPTPKPMPTGTPSGATSTPTKGSTSAVTPGGTPTAPDATTKVSGTPAPAPAATATDDVTATAVDAAGTDTVPASAPETRTDEASGGLSWIWGVALIAVLAAAAGATAVRRRRS